jgi:hypothetical protein
VPGGEDVPAPGQPGAGQSRGNRTARWHVEQGYASLVLISPRGTLVTWYFEHERKRAEADARRLNE